MAPDLAIREVRRLKSGCTVLDPMAGSGTVVREASAHGHRALGFDLDPLAVLMASVWTTPVDDDAIEEAASDVMKLAKKARTVALPWMDGDDDTKAFVNYWFASKQKTQLRRVAWALQQQDRVKDTKYRRALDVLRVSLSRIIITKDVGASLARDVSHSRPHRVADKSDYDVLEGFERSLKFVRKVLSDEPPTAGARVRHGDARRTGVPRESVDLVLTSPPYLNAIDYLRGHRLALVWLGHTFPSLRTIRSESIGAEKGHDEKTLSADVMKVRDAMTSVERLDSRHARMVERYAVDVLRLMKEIHRTLRVGGRAVLVVGNSCLRGTFIKNSAGVVLAGKRAGLRFKREAERELPESKRYLPLKKTADPALSKRMRTESVLTFSRVEG
jgi:SAM-dependent methyltransferase